MKCLDGSPDLVVVLPIGAINPLAVSKVQGIVENSAWPLPPPDHLPQPLQASRTSTAGYDGPRTVYLAFDSDANGSGQTAAQWLSRRLAAQGVSARRVLLPDGHDPNSFFVQGGNAQQFQRLLEAARP